MNGSSNRAFGSAGKSRRSKTPVLDLATVRKMLPLVGRIVEDIVSTQQRLNQLLPVQENLDRHRRDLVWPERQRRYAIHREVKECQAKLETALAELEMLSVQLVEPATGRVGFPTCINGRPAFFSWQPGELTVAHWHYEDEIDYRRPIPQDWEFGMPLRAKANQP